MSKVFIENFMGGKIYKSTEGWWIWESSGHEVKAKSKAGLISRINGYLRSNFIHKRT